jgi:vacuolar-type H+-ATPase subunit H
MQPEFQAQRPRSGYSSGSFQQPEPQPQPNDRQGRNEFGDEQQPRVQDAARTFAEAQSEFAQSVSDIMRDFTTRAQEMNNRHVSLLNDVVQSRGFGEMQSIMQRWLGENAQRQMDQTTQALQRWNGLAGQWLRVSSRQFIVPFDHVQQVLSQSIDTLRHQAEQIAQAAQNLSEQAERSLDEGLRQTQETGERWANQGQENARWFTEQAQEKTQQAVDEQTRAFGEQAQQAADQVGEEARRSAEEARRSAEQVWGAIEPESAGGKTEEAQRAGRGRNAGKGIEGAAGQAD